MKFRVCRVLSLGLGVFRVRGVLGFGGFGGWVCRV